MAESKHGGSPLSGLVAPAGIESLKSPDGSVIIVPEQVQKAAQESNTRRERARQFERRRIAMEVLPVIVKEYPPLDQDQVAGAVKCALKYADEMLAQTGNEVA